MTIDELYADTIEKLKGHKRPHIKLTPELILSLKSEWQKAMADPGNSIDESMLKKILCILDNTQNMTSEFNEYFILTLEKVRNHDLLIYALAASQKHVIGEALRSGNMISIAYFDNLKLLLKNKNPEVLEWTLRTIESMGPLSMRLKKEVREVKPNFLKIFNTHQKAALQIVDLLELQWKKML